MFPYFNFNVAGTGGTFYGTPMFGHDIFNGRHGIGIVVVKDLLDTIGSYDVTGT